MHNRMSWIITPSGISAVIDGKPFTVSRDNTTYGQIEDALRDGDSPEVIEDLFNEANAIRRFTHDSVALSEDGASLFYKGLEIHNVVVDRIREFMRDGLPYEPLVNFLERLLANPSRRSVEELYKFLEKENLPITPDGKFLGYKAIKADWTDKYTGRVRNQIGDAPEMKRREVDDDARNDCSYGFHVGSLGYALSFGSGDDRVVIVEVDPADVVSVPYSDANKLRTCKYKVVAEYEGALRNTLVVNSHSPYTEDRFDPEVADNDDPYSADYLY